MPSLSWQSVQLCPHILCPLCASGAKHLQPLLMKDATKAGSNFGNGGDQLEGLAGLQRLRFHLGKALSRKARRVLKKGPGGFWIIARTPLRVEGELLGNNRAARSSFSTKKTFRILYNCSSFLCFAHNQELWSPL